MPGRLAPPFSLAVLAPLAAVALALGLWAPAAGAGLAPITTKSALSPQLSKLATPAVRSESIAGQAETLGLPTDGAGTLVREGGRAIVEARFDSGALAALGAVKATGAKVLNASGRYQTLVLSVAPANLAALATVPGLREVTPSLAPEFNAVGSAAAVESNGLCEGGSVITQGLTQLNIAAARAQFGPRGSGETIGVISDSFNTATVNEKGVAVATHAHEDEVTNDLPGTANTCEGQGIPVKVIAESPPGEKPESYTDEGRAMVQIVHDIAPHAEIAFATANPAELSFAENIERLAAPVSDGGAGADLIVDDVSYNDEPFFQDGPIADAIRRVTEDGVAYFTATGNDNLFNAKGEEIASWEAPEFRGVGKAEEAKACGAAVVASLDEALAKAGKGPYEPDCMDFDPGAGFDTQFGITLAPGGGLTVDVQWAEPWFGVETDLYVFLVSGSGAEEEVIAEGGSDALPTLPAISLNVQNEPTEAAEARLVIARCTGAACNPEASATADPRIKFAIIDDGFGVTETEYPKGAVEGTVDTVGPNIYGHAGSPFAISVAAVNYAESATAPKSPEFYSSRGPVTHYFGPVEGNTPAAPLGAPQVIAKPDIAATDCASTTFFAMLEAGAWHFCGTSEAAPHAASIAALMQQTDPLVTPNEIREALRDSATPFTLVNSPEAVGAGMVNALDAISAIGGQKVDDPPSAVIVAPEEETKPPAPAFPVYAPEVPAPTVTITKGPSALGNETRPTFAFAADRPVTFRCQLDGGVPQPCASPYVIPTELFEGTHGFVVTGTDAEGRTGNSAIYSFTIDTTPPFAKIVGHPRKVIRTGRHSAVARFSFRANESPVTFYCQVDKEPLRICPARIRHRFGPGRHAVKVRAKDAAGNVSARPAVFHFRVKAPPRKRPHRPDPRR